MADSRTETTKYLIKKVEEEVFNNKDLMNKLEKFFK
jgi:hypothetical protein